MAENPRIARLPEKLKAVKAKDPWPFGAENHCFHLEPVLIEPQVADFEARWRINLPAEYREFIIQVSNGGAGPAYGLFPLEKALSYRGANLRAEFLLSPFPPQTLYNPYEDPKLAEYWQRSSNGQVTKEEYEARKFEEVTGT